MLNAAGSPVPAADVQVWARWFGTADRTVAKDAFGGAEISTVFLGIDHSFGRGAPVLYETMVFGGPMDGEQQRYHSRSAALVGHAAMVTKVMAAFGAQNTGRRIRVREE